GIGAEGGEKRGLVIGRAPEPAIAQARPGGDGVTPGDEVLSRARRDEIFMGKAAPFGRAAQHALFLFMVRVQGVVEPGDHPCGVAEGRMLGDVLDPLAVDPYLATGIEAVEKLLAGVWQPRLRLRHLRKAAVLQ